VDSIRANAPRRATSLIDLWVDTTCAEVLVFRPWTLWLAVAACSTGVNVSAPDADKLSFEHAWMRAVPATTPNSAAFFTVHNRGAGLIEIVDASSPVARAVELHTHAHEDGVARMRRVERFAVAGHGHHHLAPGGDHVMLIGLNGPLNDGDRVELTLTLSDGSRRTLDVPVSPSPPVSQHSHGPHGGHVH
jgi:copper(I)-binding protein